MSIITRIVEALAGIFALFYFIGSIADQNKKIRESFSLSSFSFLLLIVLIEFIYKIK